jgi:hypothetical protein
VVRAAGNEDVCYGRLLSCRTVGGRTTATPFFSFRFSLCYVPSAKGGRERGRGVSEILCAIWHRWRVSSISWYSVIGRYCLMAHGWTVDGTGGARVLLPSLVRDDAPSRVSRLH